MNTRKLVLFLAIFLSMGSFAQSDSLLNIRIFEKKALPQIGIGTNGRKYFVMSTNQDRSTLIELRKAMFKDSLLVYYEGLNEINEREITLLKGRIKDQGDAIDNYRMTVHYLEENYEDANEQNENLRKNVADLKQYIRRKRLSWWLAMGVGVAGTVLFVREKIN